MKAPVPLDSGGSLRAPSGRVLASPTFVERYGPFQSHPHRLSIYHRGWD